MTSQQQGIGKQKSAANDDSKFSVAKPQSKPWSHRERYIDKKYVWKYLTSRWALFQYLSWNCTSNGVCFKHFLSNLCQNFNFHSSNLCVKDEGTYERSEKPTFIEVRKHSADNNNRGKIYLLHGRKSLSPWILLSKKLYETSLTEFRHDAFWRSACLLVSKSKNDLVSSSQCFLVQFQPYHHISSKPNVCWTNGHLDGPTDTVMAMREHI